MFPICRFVANIHLFPILIVIMKKFLSKLILFILPFWILLTLVDFKFSQVAKHSDEHAIEAWYDLMNGNVDADVIVMGNSRALVNVDPLILDSVLHVNSYNLGIDGRSVSSQVRKYHLFKAHNKKPKLIIHNIDIFSFHYRPGIMKYQFYPYFWDQSVRQEYMPSEPFTAGEKYLPMYRFIHIDRLSECGFLDFLSSDSSSLIKGYRRQPKSWDGKALKNIDSIPFVVNDTTVRMFDEYLAEVKADGIPMVFVYAPMYIEATRKITNIKQVYAAFQKFADKYSIPVLDYTYMGLSYDTTYFYNAMHLNDRGAEIYSDSLANDIKRLGILKR